MAQNNTRWGKAFEYSCLSAIERKASSCGQLVMIENSAYCDRAKNYYNELDSHQRDVYDKAADAAADAIFPLEPQFEFGDGILYLSIMPDSAGQGPSGDVRDVLCVRVGDWEIGLSCKHNHMGVKHPRITEAKDFGRVWLGYPCGQEFIDKMNAIINPIEELQRQNALWRDIPDKQERFYKPVLEAFIDEFENICSAHADAPAKLLSYFFGTNDFYKVISNEKRKVTHIQAFNINGTLNKPANGHRPITKVAKANLPSRLLDASFKRNKNGSISSTTIILTFDGGWAVSLRLHNKDERIKTTGLSFEVEMVGMASGTHQEYRTWR